MERYFGPDMKLIPKKAGYAGLTNEYNGYNQVVRTVYRDTEWKPVRNDERQLAIVEYRYAGTDMWEPAVYEAYFDEKGVPCESLTGAYARSMVYGGPKMNLLLEEAFFDANGGRTVSVLNQAHRVAYGYSGDLRQTSARYYDVEGKPAS